MSELTKRLRDRIISASLRNDKTGALEMREIRDPLCVEAADRIDALEECLRECVYCLEHDVTVERSIALLNKARALLEAHD